MISIKMVKGGEPENIFNEGDKNISSILSHIIRKMKKLDIHRMNAY
jgi:hypothetical protein